MIMKKTNIRASLRIMGEDYKTEEITKILEIIPSEIWNRGDRIRNLERKRTYTAWIYNTDTIETMNINDLVKELESIFLPNVEKICELKQKYDLDISLDFVIIIENGEVPAIYFEPQFIQFAAKIGARFDIDTYVN